jgi:adenylate cyclase
MAMKKYPYELLEDPRELSAYLGWSEEVYRDFLACQRGTLSPAEFHQKYQQQKTILSIDMTGFTAATMKFGELESLLRILDVQKVCIPVLRDFSARQIRCCADDITAIFDDPNNAIDAAFEIHRRVKLFRNSAQASAHPTQCSIGIGHGIVLAIGPDLAQGDEMNRSSKLGEDIARADETLLTERAHEVLKERTDIRFDPQVSDDQLFPFYRAIPV